MLPSTLASVVIEWYTSLFLSINLDPNTVSILIGPLGDNEKGFLKLPTVNEISAV